MSEYIYSPESHKDPNTINILKYVDALPVKEHYIKISLYNPYAPSGEQELGNIEGVVTQGNITVNGASAIRRSGSLTLVIPDRNIFGAQFGGKTIHKVTDLTNLIAINKRAQISVGFSNSGSEYTEYSIFWFPIGYFTLQDPSVTNSGSGVQVQVKLSDFMTLLNGTDGGELQMSIEYSPIVNVGGAETSVTFADIVTTLIKDMGGISDSTIEIPKTIDNQIYRWAGNDNLYLYEEEEAEERTKYCLSTTKPDNKAYSILQYQDPVGIQTTDFAPVGTLSSNAGETIVSVLDKIKKSLGNYEYFFDINGKFHFKEIDNGLNDGVAPDDLLTAIQEKYFASGNEETEPDYEFTDGQLVTSYSNTPKFDMVKNDLVAWGKSGTTKLGIRYHLLIDKMPTIDPNTDRYECQSYTDNFGIQRILTATKPEEGVMGSNVITPTDWRHLMYLQAIQKSNENKGLSAFEKELVEELPKIYDVVGASGFFQDANPVALDYWVDMIDTATLGGLNDATLVQNMAISDIGDRTKSYNDDSVNCIFAPTINDIRLFENEAAKAVYDEQVGAGKAVEYTKYCVVGDDAVWKNLEKGSSYNAAFDYIRSLLHEHISANNAISLSVLPLYHLEPNMRIKVDDNESDIHGDYIINSLTMPLTTNGLMTIQATRVVERI